MSETLAQPTLPLSTLALSPLNVRPMNPNDDVTELKANILAQGLIQPLVVRVAERTGTDMNEVTAGGRRLRALMELAAEGAIDDDYAVKVTGEDGDDTDALSRSLAENMIRRQMSPVEEFEAFVRLADQGRTEEQIATEYGTDVRHVKGRLRLGRLAEPIRQALAEGTITLDLAKVFTACEDTARQQAVFESFDDIRYAYPHMVRTRLMDGRVRADDTLPTLIGREAYEARGGTVSEDLFGDESYFDDAALVEEIALEVLQAQAEEKREADGWAWGMASLDYDDEVRALQFLSGDRVEPTDEEVEECERIEKRMEEIEDGTEPSEGFETIHDEFDALEERHDELLAGKRTYSDTAKEHGGVIVVVMPSGKIETRVGAVRPEDIEKIRAANASDTEDAGGSDDTPTEAFSGGPVVRVAPTTQAEQPKASLKRPVVEDLAIFRGLAVSEAFVRKPDIAHKYLVYVLACAILGGHDCKTYSDSAVFSDDVPHGSIGGLGLSAKTPCPTDTAKAVIPDLPAMAVIAEAKAQLEIDWMTKGTVADRLEAFLKLPAKAVKAIEAYCVASMVRSMPFCLPEDTYRRKDQDTAIKAAARAAGADVRRSFTPTGANLLGRLTKPQLMDIVGEILGEDRRAEFTGHAKVALVADVEKFFDGRADLDPEQKARADAWMPADLSFETSAPKATADADEEAGADERDANIDADDATDADDAPEAIAA